MTFLSERLSEALMISDTDILASGRSVLETEVKGLRLTLESLDDAFATAVKLVLNSQGHVIVIGMGKSGHIGRKIAASFASTGTPAFFLHPAEAAHGDLGMITPGATILALSFSGESTEVNGVVDYAIDLKSPVISITGSAVSTLSSKADISLTLPMIPEACPNNLAPTTSTTATLALGDALCVAVMTARGFSAEDFGKRHPAGKLGFGLKRVSQYLNETPSSVPHVETDAAMSSVILEITSGGKGCVAVMNSGVLCGIITDGDLRRAMSSDIMTKTAQDIMSTSPFTLTPDMRIKDVLTAFTERKIGNAFVVEKDEVLGLIDLKTLVSTGYV